MSCHHCPTHICNRRIKHRVDIRRSCRKLWYGNGIHDGRQGLARISFTCSVPGCCSFLAQVFSSSKNKLSNAGCSTFPLLILSHKLISGPNCPVNVSQSTNIFRNWKFWLTSEVLATMRIFREKISSGIQRIHLGGQFYSKVSAAIWISSSIG